MTDAPVAIPAGSTLRPYESRSEAPAVFAPRTEPEPSPQPSTPVTELTGMLFETAFSRQPRVRGRRPGLTA
jgi:hypothetical protein